MRIIFLLGLLLTGLLLAGCQSTCDGRGPSDICELHHGFMHSEIVANPKRPMPSQAYLEARIKGFVHAPPFYLPPQFDKCMVNICDQCVQAEQVWKQQHPWEN